MSKFEFVKRSELPAVLESDAAFLEGIMNYLEDRNDLKIMEDSVEEDKENKENKENREYKIKRMPKEFSRAQRNQTRLSEGLWTVELRELKKPNIFVDDVAEDRLVWELVQERMDVWPKGVVLLDVEGRQWPVDVTDTLGGVLGRKICVLEFPAFIVLH